MALSIEVKGDRLLIKPDAVPKQAGEIILPESIASQPTTGTILAIGDGPSCSLYSEGMRIAFPERVGVLARLDDEHVRFLDPTDVLMVLH